MYLLQISDENVGKIIDQGSKVLDHGFDLNATSVFGFLVVTLIIGNVVQFINNRIKEKEKKEAQQQVVQIAQSSYESLAQMNSSQMSKVLEMAADLTLIKQALIK